MSYLDYIDRTVDVVAFTGKIPSGGIPQQMTLAAEGDGGQIHTGILKLSQRFMLLLLTPQGTIKYFPLLGTDFMPQLQQGLLRTSLDVYAAFSSAVADVQDQLLSEETEDDPDDERFESAELVQLHLTLDSASLTIQITSRAGTSRQVVMPLSVTV